MTIRWNIRRKLNGVLTLCGLVFITICAPIISYLSFEEYQYNAQAQQVRLVGVLSTSAAIATFVSNEEIAEEVLNGLLQDDEILAAQIVGKAGFSKQAQSDDARHTIVLGQQNMRRYPLYSPVNATDEVGEINVWANSALIAQRATRIVLKDIVSLVVLTLLLAVASMFAANILVAAPLRRLADQVMLTKPGEQGEIDVEKIHVNDEIGLVTRSVNDFLSVTRVALDKERELRVQIEQMNEHFSNVFANSRVGIMVVDQNGILLHHNPVLMESIIKLDASQQQALAHQDIFSLAFTDSLGIWAIIDTARSTQETVECDLSLVAAWRQPFWVHCIFTVTKDGSSGDDIIECVLYDVTRRIQEADAARQLAQQDSLTGLNNRRGCERYFEAWSNEQREKDALVAMLLDLDSFKPINDQFGHSAGDLVLQTIAKRLQREVRADVDLIGRIGGDEFVVFLKMKHDRRDLVEHMANKILKSVATPIVLDSGQIVAVGVSIGIAFASDFNHLDDLMKAADEAMYQVKIKGKNDFIFAS